MADRERVINELNECIEHIRFNEFEKIPFWGNCQMAMTDALELLKKQEPMKPRSVSLHGAYPQIQHYCGACNAFLPRHKQEFCSVCGQAVKWEREEHGKINED